MAKSDPARESKISAVDTKKALREQAQKYSRLYHAALGRNDVHGARILAVELSTHPGASKAEQRTFQSHRKTLEQGKLPYTVAQRSVLAPATKLSRLKEAKEAKVPKKSAEPDRALLRAAENAPQIHAQRAAMARVLRDALDYKRMHASTSPSDRMFLQTTRADFVKSLQHLAEVSGPGSRLEGIANAAIRDVRLGGNGSEHIKQAREATGGRSGERGASTKDDASKVLDALHKQTSADPRSALHSMADVRKHSGLSKEAFDKAALQLQKEGKIGMHHHDMPQSVPSDRRKHHVVGANGTEFHAVESAKAGSASKASDVTSSHLRALHADIDKSERGRNTSEGFAESQKAKAFLDQARAAESRGHHEKAREMYQAYANKSAELARHPGLDRDMRRMNANEAGEGLRGVGRMDKKIAEAPAKPKAEAPAKPKAEVHKLPPPAGYGAKLREGQLARLKSAHAPGGVPVKSVKGDALERAYKTGKKGGRFYEVGGRRVYARKGK